MELIYSLLGNPISFIVIIYLAIKLIRATIKWVIIGSFALTIIGSGLGVIVDFFSGLFS